MIDIDVKKYLVKVCTVLNNHKVDYIVVGGAAVSHYGYNRPSGIGSYHKDIKTDLDFWYNPTNENFHNLLKALKDLEVDTSDLKKIVFDNKRTFLKIPHKDFHTDFLPVMIGLDSFKLAKEKADPLDIGVQIKILSFDDLILNKKMVNRKTDESDIEELHKLKKRRNGRGM